ncbi:hypothetical protein [Catalinimonas alkaloidigena]|nr:hypothetical protein [Catalinimonas alkaloidigena]
MRYNFVEMTGSSPVSPSKIIMDNQEIYDLYVLQSKNVRRLKQVQKSLIKDINFYMQKNDSFQVEIKTKLLALLYCTISEAQFIQILHTPSGFSYTEITQIKNQRSITESWKLMIDLAMGKVGNWQDNDDLSSRRNKLHEIIKTYIEEPHGIRNKIAHGQWIHALNSNNTKENEEITQKISNLNVIDLTIWSEVHQYLALIIRDLVQSPQIGHHNNYWVNLVDLEQYLEESKDWTIEKRKERLKKKKKQHPTKPICKRADCD